MQAGSSASSLAREMAYLAVHGTLHLLAMIIEGPKDRAAMRAKRMLPHPVWTGQVGDGHGRTVEGELSVCMAGSQARPRPGAQFAHPFVLAAFALGLAAAFALSRLEWALVVLCIGMVVAAELLTQRSRSLVDLCQEVTTPSRPRLRIWLRRAC